MPTDSSTNRVTRLRVEHDTVFQYSHEVFVEPHTLRLRPRSSWRQRLISFDLVVEPEPAGRADNLGLNDSETVVWFSGLTRRLRICTSSIVDLPESQPFAFLLDESFLSLPATYPLHEQVRLSPYLWRKNLDPEVASYAAGAAQASGHQVLPFLSELARRIWRDFDKTIREDGDPMLPQQTLAGRQGACRDLAELFVDACRSQGLAARFVSGYSESEVIDDVRYLHAWSEVYLPGGGWRGFDPSLGIAVSNRHVAIAHGPSYAEARPYEGSFRGTGATATLRADVRMSMETLPDPEVTAHEQVQTTSRRQP